MSKKLWGGRFEKATNPAVDDFTSSIRFDSRMAREDIAGSIAHATMLGERGIIDKSDAALIVRGLDGILLDLEDGKIEFDVAAEDIHMNVETLLIARIGDAGKRLHTGRSRNDQVALDTRLYLRAHIDQILALLTDLRRCIVDIAKLHIYTVMPGYTHLQKAQPVTLAHHVLAYFQMLTRDAQRFRACRARVNVLPLGAGALAGTTYPLDRERVRELPGFDAVSENSLDAVSDRDFAIEYCACASILMMHLSRFCEELVLWSSHEFGFAVMDDAYSTGSSIMPQKKNPDVAELIRGKTGRVYGSLMGLLTMMKGLPLAYNKDMQEDKEQLFDACDTLEACLTLFRQMLSTTTFNAAVMARGAEGGFTNATDAADYLVKKGLPFREAHEVIGKLVLSLVKDGRSLGDLTLAEFQSFCPLFDADVFKAVSIETCVSDRSVYGGPAPEAVKRQIENAEKVL